MDIKTTCRTVSEKCLVTGGSGNVSERDGDSFHITLSGARLDSIETILACRVDSSDIPQGASLETIMHREIYRERQDIMAVIHANPPYSTLFSCTNGLKVDTSLIPEGQLIDPVHWVAALPAGSEELAKAVGSGVTMSNVLILRNHGVVTVGKDLKEALNRLEYLELICRIEITAKMSNIELQGNINSRYKKINKEDY